MVLGVLGNGVFLGNVEYGWFRLCWFMVDIGSSWC